MHKICVIIVEPIQNVRTSNIKMAQGKMKTKVKVPGKTKQKHNHKAKKQILKKGI